MKRTIMKCLKILDGNLDLHSQHLYCNFGPSFLMTFASLLLHFLFLPNNVLKRLSILVYSNNELSLQKTVDKRVPCGITNLIAPNFHVTPISNCFGHWHKTKKFYVPN